MTEKKEQEEEKTVYRPLSYVDGEIRLLKSTPMQPNEPLKFTMMNVALAEAPLYVALSYYWGDPHRTASVEVDDVDMQITINLEAALRRLVAEDVEFVWADALCINQKDIFEKSLQIPRMAAIFNKASVVAVWLGDELDIDESARAELRNGTSPSLGEDFCLSSQPTFKQILRRPYWRRVWVVQELAMASHIDVYCGSDRIPWDSIDTTCKCCQSRSFINTRGLPVDEHVFQFTMLREVRKNISRGKAMSLLDVLHRTRHCLATNPRDKIFGVLGLASDARRFIAEPSYKGSFSDIFTAFATQLLSHNILDFIYLRSANRRVDKALPSWVPDWTDLDDHVARRQFDYLIIHSKSIQIPETETLRREPKAIGFLSSATNGLENILATESM